MHDNVMHDKLIKEFLTSQEVISTGNKDFSQWIYTFRH